MKIAFFLPLLFFTLVISKKANSQTNLPTVKKLLNAYKTLNIETVHKFLSGVGYQVDNIKSVDSINKSVDCSYINGNNKIYLRLTNGELSCIYYNIPSTSYFADNMASLVGTGGYSVNAYSNQETKTYENYYTKTDDEIGIKLVSAWDFGNKKPIYYGIIGWKYFIAIGITDMQIKN